MNERVVFVERDDEVSDLIDALKRIKADKVVFVIPRGATLFQSIINLKILRTRAEELTKWLFAVTKDERGQRLLDTAGIPVFGSLEEYEATSIEKVFQSRQKKHKSLNHRTFSVDKILEKENPSNETDEEERINWHEILLKPSKTLLIILTLVSVALFFFVSFIALPGATVFIKPERKTLETVINVTLLPEDVKQDYGTFVRRKVINGFTVQTELEKTMDFTTVTKIFEGTHATGEIIIVNAHSEPRTLVPKTRFQSEEGIVYRIADWVKVPGATSEGNGELVVKVVADEYDIYGQVTGEKGNISAPQKLILPGLPPAGQEVLWAELREDMGGGVTSWYAQVTERDYELARENIKEKAFKEAQEDLEQYLREKNVLEFTNLGLIPESQFTKREVVSVEIDESYLGGDAKTFPVKAKVRLESWAYDKDELLAVLHEILEREVDPDMYLELINFSTITIEVLGIDQEIGGLKVNVYAKGIEAYLIEPKTESGIIFVNKVKEKIVNKSIVEAENLLINMPEIADVKINSWPFFSRSIPRLPENISVRMWDE